MKIFVATAMERQASHELETMQRLRAYLVEAYGAESVFLACVDYPTPESYLPPRASYDVVADWIVRAHLFVLYFPQKVYSGALVELGMALAWGKPVLVFTPSAETLPYMLREGARQVTVVKSARHDWPETITPESAATDAFYYFLKTQEALEALPQRFP